MKNRKIRRCLIRGIGKELQPELANLPKKDWSR